MISVLRAADRIATPWKNGGGITREVAIWPPGSDFENFDWRVSIAEVCEAALFGFLPGSLASLAYAWTKPPVPTPISG